MSLSFRYAPSIHKLSQFLGEVLSKDFQENEIFYSPFIIVPGRNIKKWLNLSLSQNLEIAANLDFYFLEDGIFELFKRLYLSLPENQNKEIENIGVDLLNLFIQSTIHFQLEQDAKGLSIFYSYLFQPSQKQKTPRLDYDLRLWQLSSRLSSYFREYEYHIPDLIYRYWNKGELKYANSKGEHPLELAQSIIYKSVYGKKSNGFLKIYNARASKKVKILTSVYYLKNYLDKHKKKIPNSSVKEKIYFFVFPDVTLFHYKAIELLSEFYDIIIFTIGYIDPSYNKLVFKNSLLSKFAKPLQRELELKSKINIESTKYEGTKIFSETLLSQLQKALYQNSEDANTQLPPQDKSIQIVGAPGVIREVECVWNSILFNLQENPDIKFDDIAVAVTDIGRYKFAIQSVFDPNIKTIPYNLNDIDAKKESVFAKAVLDMIRIGISNYTKTDIFALVMNPCFLESCKITKEDAHSWLELANQLNIFHSLDEQDRRLKKYIEGSQFTWSQGFKRLRFGKILDLPEDENKTRPFHSIHKMVPFENIDSSNDKLIEAFFSKIEMLLYEMKEMKDIETSGLEWFSILESLVQRYLEIPETLQEEEYVRTSLLEKLKYLEVFDIKPEDSKVSRKIGLTSIIQFLESNIGNISTSIGSNLTGGITFASIPSLLNLEFKIIYIIGLSEGNFPGKSENSSLNLLSEEYERELKQKREVILIKNNKSDEDRFLFLQLLHSATQKLYLFYDNRDLSKDEELFPSSVLYELIEFLGNRIQGNPKLEYSNLLKKFNGIYTVQMPQNGYSDSYYHPIPDGIESITDVIVNYSLKDSILNYIDQHKSTESIYKAAASELLEKIATKDFPGIQYLQSSKEAKLPDIKKENYYKIYLSELKNFLKEPLQATLRKRLGLKEEEDDEKDTELFVFGNLEKAIFTTQALRHYVMNQNVDMSIKAFEEYYQWKKFKSDTPEGSFGIYQFTELKNSIKDRIVHKEYGLKGFIESRRNSHSFYTLSLGLRKKIKEVEDHIHIPSLRLEISDGVIVEFFGFVQFLWKNKKTKQIDMLIINNQKDGDKNKSHHILEAYLFMILCQSRISECLELFFGCDFHFYVSHQNGIREWTYTYESSINYLNILVDLVNDYLFDQYPDFIPFEAFKDLKTDGKNISEIEPDKLAEGFKEKVEEKMNGIYPIHVADFVKLIQQPYSSELGYKIQKRFGLLFKDGIK